MALLLNPTTVSWLIDKSEPFSQNTIDAIHTVQLLTILFGFGAFMSAQYALPKLSLHIRRAILTVFTLFIAVSIALLVSEVLVRLLIPQHTLNQLKSLSPAIYEVGENISWVYKPGTNGNHVTGEFNSSYYINSFGMRDEERLLKKSPNVTRILLLGDSFTAGFGVQQNETYAYLLEQMLNQPDRPVEVWNAGIDGYSPDTEYVLLKDKIEMIKPDIVMLGFYVANDVTDLCKNSWETDPRGLPQRVHSNLVLVENNQLRFADNHLNSYKIGVLKYVDIILMRISHLYILIKKTFFAGGNVYSEGIYVMIDKFPEMRIQLERTKHLLTELANLSTQHNATFHLIIIPERSQVNEEEWNIVRQKFARYSPDRDRPQKELVQWCNENNITCIDLFPALRASTEQTYYLITDSHFTTAGHRVAAETIAKTLRERHGGQ
ncbi:MAG: hypothetical protein HY363_00235 [Candidatus Aenigmarchaeota archaeon]|nr:hypothetical protein [Candidatus Aenigmarchaeota archaeon]